MVIAPGYAPSWNSLQTLWPVRIQRGLCAVSVQVTLEFVLDRGPRMVFLHSRRLLLCTFRSSTASLRLLLPGTRPLSPLLVLTSSLHSLKVTQQILLHWQPFRDLKLKFVGSRRAEQLSLRSQHRIVTTVEESVLRILVVASDVSPSGGVGLTSDAWRQSLVRPDVRPFSEDYNIVLPYTTGIHSQNKHDRHTDSRLRLLEDNSPRDGRGSQE